MAGGAELRINEIVVDVDNFDDVKYFWYCGDNHENDKEW